MKTAEIAMDMETIERLRGEVELLKAEVKELKAQLALRDAKLIQLTVDAEGIQQQVVS